MVQMMDIESAELARCLFNEANDAFLIVDPTSMSVLDANAAAQRLTGMRKKALLAAKLGDLLEGGSEDLTRQLIAACHSTCFFHSQEGYALKCEGDVPLEVNVSVARLHGETVTLGLVVIRDITERKRVEASLRDTNERLQCTLDDLRQSQEIVVRQERMRAIGQMASGTAHELNNLLTPIVHCSELLLERTDSEPESREQLELISRAAHDAADVVRRLQLVHGRGHGPIETVNLDELLQEIPDLTRPKWHNEALQTGREVVFDLQLDDVPPVQGNPTELRQVLMNFVFNAVEAMPDGGRVTLRLRALAQKVLVEVTDTGIGMNKEERKRCLDPFFTTKEEGAGLGLSVCHGIVEGYGGSLEIDSDATQGTTVRMILPCTDVASKEAVSEDDDAGSQPPPSNLRILYVEDDDRVRASFGFMAGSLGWQVDLAEDGPTGLAMFQSAAYDVVVTDLGMPGMDGKEVTQLVKQIRPETSVVVISGWAEKRVLEAFQGETKPDFVLPKPTDMDYLEKTLAKIQARQQRRKHALESI